MNDFEIEINKLLSELPEKNRKAILSSRWQGIANQIAKKYSLSKEQNDDLIREIWIILVGGGDIDDFKNIIQTELSISSILAEELSREIYDRIFLFIIGKIEGINPNNPETEYNKTPIENLDIPPDNLPTEEDQVSEINENNDDQNQIHNDIIKPTFVEETNIENTNKEIEIKKVDFNNKFDNVTKTTNVDSKLKPYTVDPYREPIE